LSTGNIDIKVTLYATATPTTPKLIFTVEDIAPKATKYLRMDSVDSRDYKVPLTDEFFNGSAIVEAFVADTNTPTIIAGTVVELANTNPLVANIYTDPAQRYTAAAYEATRNGATTLYMATALCNSNGTTTTYAVQNIDALAATVKVTYSDSQQQTQTIQPGAKYSFDACTVHGASFSGSAKIESTNSKLITAIGKAWKTSDANFVTAFEGVMQGGAKIALPYVRYTSDTNYNNGSRQRTFIAIQNVGNTTVYDVQVKYLNASGGIVGTHTITSIDPNKKANSWATLASGNASQLQEFGYPESNLGGVYGGAVIIEDAGSQLIALARVTTKDTNTNSEVAEDYMATIVP
jgi:hypothetical protein